MAMWNPWRGCKKCSDGCQHSYINKGEAKRKVNTNDIVKTSMNFSSSIYSIKFLTYLEKSDGIHRKR